MPSLLEHIKSQGYSVMLFANRKVGIAPPPVSEIRQMVIEHKAELLAELEANDEAFPLDDMEVLDEFYGLSDAGDYQFVLADIKARPEIRAWAEQEVKRLIQIKKCS